MTTSRLWMLPNRLDVVGPRYLGWHMDVELLLVVEATGYEEGGEKGRRGVAGAVGA